MTPTVNSNNGSSGTVKFLYSYNGKIAPRQTDGELRYVGGYTRVLAVDRSITFAELMVKFGELCGSSMILKCKLPTEDLDVLVSVTSDEDLRNVVGEYNRFSLSAHRETKIRAVLFPFPSLKKVSPPPSPVSIGDSSPPTSLPYRSAGFDSQTQKPPFYPYGGRTSSPASFSFSYPISVQKDARKSQHYPFREQAAPRSMHVAAPHRNLRQ